MAASGVVPPASHAGPQAPQRPALGCVVICPFGREVGDPPLVTRCPAGFPGCACGDELVIQLGGTPDVQSKQVFDWWTIHGADL